MKRIRPAHRLAAAVLLASMPLTSCNLFDPFDSPSGDDQLLSAARACFDQGDLVCARENYSKLSSSQADVAQSELAFAALDEVGASMAGFMEFVGAGAGGAGLTSFAEKIARNGANSTVRRTIHEAYLRHQQITGNVELKNFVKFVTSVALAAEVLAEVAGGDGVLSKTDIAGSASCSAANNLGACALAGTSPITATAYATGDLEATGTGPYNTTPAWGYVNTALSVAQTSLQALGAAGDFDSGGDAFNTIAGIDPVGATAMLRGTLIDQGVGR